MPWRYSPSGSPPTAGLAVSLGSRPWSAGGQSSHPRVVSGDVATTATVWSNVVAGVVAVVLGLGAMSLGIDRTR
ncbi:MAG: SPW repeat protein [Chloroflexi bacterium]|nr:SPW repeat protein [Chloroflexota bacterium]